MSKNIALGITALFTLVIPALLILTGCPWHSDSLYGLNFAGDGNGGAIAVYEDSLGGNIYARKISPDGNKMWGEKGVLLGSSHSRFYSFQFTHVINDGSGGASIAWPEITSSQEPRTTSVYHIVKLDSGGRLLWQKDFERVDQLIDDGAGGAIFDYSPDGKTLLAVKIDADGGLPWGEVGVSLPHPGNTRQIASDGLGGVVIALEELRYPEGAQPGETFSNGYIYAQRIDSQGQFSWGEEGILLYTTPENAFAESPQISGDGSGGAIITWQQQPKGRIESGSPEARVMDILVQKVDANGNVLWRDGGLPLEINKAVEEAFPIEPRLVSDGSGGAIIIWRDMRHDPEGEASVYAQRIDADGTISWQAGGVKVASTSLNPFPMIVSNGSGGAIISYSLQKGLYIQKVNSNGKTAWPENGVPVAEGEYEGRSIAPDGQGGVIVAWGVGKSTFSPEKAYLQRVSTEGKLLWGEEGIRLGK
jgi:hypothetical protein